MRPTLTLLLLLFFTGLYAQADTSVIISDTASERMDRSPWAPLLAASHWLETSPGSRNGYVLTLDLHENFTEDAGIRPNRKFQFLRGRWILDTAESTITLAVDGLMSGGNLDSRYLRGRDYYIVYDLVSVSTDHLELKNRLTGKSRTFERTEAEDFKDPMIEEKTKLELPGSKGGKLKLPGGWGG